MQRDEIIDNSIGISRILDRFESDSFLNKILICGSFKQGKTYALKCIEEKFIEKGISDSCIFKLNISDYIISGINDFVPFIKLLNEFENIEKENIKQIAKTLLKETSKIAKVIIELLDRDSVSPSIYNEAEKSILARLTNIIGLKQGLLFLCDDVDKWDPASIALLQKLMLFDNTNSWSKYTTFVLTATDGANIKNLFCQNETVSTFKLNSISENALKLYLEKYNIGISAKDLYQITFGNIGLISEIIDNRNLPINTYENNLQPLLLNELNKNINIDKSAKALDMINRSSIVGYAFPRKLLEELSELDTTDFYEAMFAAKKSQIYIESRFTIRFKEENFWSILYNYNNENYLYHLAYANALKKIVPSDFYRRAREHLLSDNINDAADAYFTYCIEYLKKYHQIITDDTIFLSVLKEYGLIKYRENLMRAYECYFLEEFNKAEDYLNFDTENFYVRFQKDYLKALILINNTTLQSAYRDASIILQNLVCNAYFAQNEPYLWIQTAITKLEVTSETGESSNNLLSEIMSQFDKFIDIDKQFQIEYYSFKSKNNYTYNIDIQQRETKEAFDYFKKEISIPGKSMYMCSLINHQANTLVIGDYDEVIKLSENTIAIFSAYRELDPYLSAFTNNYIIAEILKDFNILDTMSASYISAFKKTLSTNSKYKISNVLYKINLGLVYFYSGKTEHAFQLYEDLLKEFASEEDVDHYYKYFIINNYNIIGLCTGKLSSYSFIDELKKLNPLPNNKVFFERRNKELQNFVKQLKEPSQLCTPMGMQNILGKAWTFWGRPLLFSDVQFWTD